MLVVMPRADWQGLRLLGLQALIACKIVSHQQREQTTTMRKEPGGMSNRSGLWPVVNNVSTPHSEEMVYNGP